MGGLEIIDSKEFERIANRSSSVCCILHCSDESAHSGLLTLSQYFSTKRYSQNFLDFLCKCLRFSETDRSSVEQLQHHPWITSKADLKGPLVDLKELIQIGNQWRHSANPSEYQGSAERQLERLCEAMVSVLPCCEDYDGIVERFSKGQIDDEAVKELALDIGLDVEAVWKQLMKVIKAIQDNKDKT